MRGLHAQAGMFSQACEATRGIFVRPEREAKPHLSQLPSASGPDGYRYILFAFLGLSFVAFQFLARGYINIRHSLNTRTV